MVCLFSIASCHRKVKPPRNYIGGLKQNFDRMCAKIATLEEKLNHQEEKLKDQEEELNDLKMQRDDRGQKLITQTCPCITENFFKIVKYFF